MSLTEVSGNRCFGGTQFVYRHRSAALDCEMNFGLFLPPQAATGAVPLLVYLSGLTCTEQNVITKAGAQSACAQHGLALLCPDTSPRGPGVAETLSSVPPPATLWRRPPVRPPRRTAANVTASPDHAQASQRRQVRSGR